MLLFVIVLRDLGAISEPNTVLLSKLSSYMVIIYLHVCLLSETWAPWWQTNLCLPSARARHTGFPERVNFSIGKTFLHSINICLYHYQNKRKKQTQWTTWPPTVATASSHGYMTSNGCEHGKDQRKCGPWNILKNITIRDMEITTMHVLVVKVGRERLLA